MPDSTPVNLDALQADLDALRDELRDAAGPEDARHLRRVVAVGHAFSLIGWATAWIAPNPVAVVGMSTGLFARWAMVAHPVLHRGYDGVEGVPERYTSQRFARGWRRWLDWPDWIDPAAWNHEHNVLHHYRLGEDADPDQPERNLEIVRRHAPMWLRYVLVALTTFTWKWFYYAPNTMRALHNRKARLPDGGEPVGFLSWRMWAPWAGSGRATWARCYLPYLLIHFVLLPLPFLAISRWAWMSVLVNRALAEVLTNLHAYLIIVPNHAGEDVYRFDTRMQGRGDFYLRQIVGTANYRTGGFARDFFHGWLNYQIEHHLFPDLTMRQYALAQPRVQAICEKHGLPYLQESVFVRFKRLVQVLVGRRSMPTWDPTAPARVAL